MKEFYNFNVVITPGVCADISQELVGKYSSFKGESKSQVESVIDTVNQIRQNSILQNPAAFLEQTAELGRNIKSKENIYGKAASITENRESVAKAYQEISGKDIRDLDTLTVNINGTKIRENNVIEKAGSPPTIDKVINYLEKTYKVQVSPAQRNFLRTQWNQASVVGAASMFYLGFPVTSASFKDQNHPPYHMLNFGADGKLMSAQYVANIVAIEDDQKTGVFTTTADISNLKDLVSSEDDKWIPQHAPNSVSVNYRSNDIACGIVPEVQEAIQKVCAFRETLTNNEIKQWVDSSVSSLEIAKILKRITYLDNTSKSGFEQVLDSIVRAIDKFKNSGEDVGNIIEAIPYNRTDNKISSTIRSCIVLQKSGDGVDKIIEKLNGQNERSLYEDLIKAAITRFQDNGEDVAKILAVIPEDERKIYANEISTAINAQQSEAGFNAVLSVMTNYDSLRHGRLLNEARNKFNIVAEVKIEENIEPESIDYNVEDVISKLTQNSLNDNDVVVIKRLIRGEVDLDKGIDVGTLIQSIPSAKLHIFKDEIHEFMQTDDGKKIAQNNQLVFLEIADDKQAMAEILKMATSSSILQNALYGGYYNAALKIAKYGNVKIRIDPTILDSNGWKKIIGATTNDKLRQMIYDKIPENQRKTEDFTNKASPLFLAIKYKQYDFALALIDKGHSLKNNKEIEEYNKENTNTNINQKKMFDRLTGKDKERLEQIKQNLTNMRKNSSNTASTGAVNNRPKELRTIEC